MKAKEHIRRIRESLDVIGYCLENPYERQRALGLLVSITAVDLLELYLHKLGLIDPGFQLKHTDFKSRKRIMDKLPFDFPKKDEIIEIILEIERMRDSLAYGRVKGKYFVDKFISLWRKLLNIFNELGVLDEI